MCVPPQAAHAMCPRCDRTDPPRSSGFDSAQLQNAKVRNKSAMIISRRQEFELRCPHVYKSTTRSRRGPHGGAVPTTPRTEESMSHLENPQTVPSPGISAAAGNTAPNCKEKDALFQNDETETTPASFATSLLQKSNIAPAPLCFTPLLFVLLLSAVPALCTPLRAHGARLCSGLDSSSHGEHGGH